MARPAEFTDDMIVEAGVRLQQEGKRVTAFGIRNHMGGGNVQRIKAIWEGHETGEVSEAAEAELVHELPVDVMETLEEVVTGMGDQMRAMAVRVNHIAVMTAERRTTEAVKDARERQESAEAELSDAADAVSELEAKVDSLGKTLEEREAAVQALQRTESGNLRTISELQGQLKTVGERHDKVQARAQTAEAQLQVARNELADLTGKHELHCRSLETERQMAMTDQKEELREMHSQVLAETKDAHATLLAELTSGHEMVKKSLSERIDSQSEQISSLNTRLDIAANQRDQARETVDQLKEEIRAHLATIKNLEQRIPDAEESTSS